MPEHWFCFDDSIVTCVTRQQIQKHYAQNDCAYMLFYRQKNLRSTSMDCSDSKTNDWSTLPCNDHRSIIFRHTLFNSIVVIGRNFRKESNSGREKVVIASILAFRSIVSSLFREAYEKFENRLPITIYPGEWFEVVDDGRLNLNNNDQFLFPDLYGACVFDKRTKVDEFLAKLEVCSLFSMTSSTVIFAGFRRLTASAVIITSPRNFVRDNCMWLVNWLRPMAMCP